MGLLNSMAGPQLTVSYGTAVHATVSSDSVTARTAVTAKPRARRRQDAAEMDRDEPKTGSTTIGYDRCLLPTRPPRHR